MRNIRTFNSFRLHVFRLYFGGLLGQMAAMNMQQIARSLLVYRMTGSAAILGVISLANSIPMLGLSLFGGVLADRIQKKYVMLMGQAASGVVTLGVAVALSLGYLSTESGNSWWILIVASLLQGSIQGLMMPSRQAMLPEIVGGEELMNAVSLTTMGMNVLQIIGPALAGFLLDAFDFDVVYYSMTAMYLMSVAFITFLPKTSTISQEKRNAINDIKAGFTYVKRDATVRVVLMVSLFVVILSMPFMQLLPVFTETILHVGASGLGILLSVSGAGAILCSLTLASLPNKKRGLMLLVGSLLLGVALTAFSFSTSWHLSLALIVFVGIGQTLRMSLSNTLIQYYVEDEYRGRMMSLYMMQFGLTSFSAFLAGVLSDRLGVQWSVGGFAVGLVVFAILAIIFVRSLRNLD